VWGTFSTILIIRRATFQRRHWCQRQVGGMPLLHPVRIATHDRIRLAPEHMFVKAGGIDNSEWFKPVIELFVTRRRPWLAPVPGAQQFETNPPL
jgi:hypothetical protein